MSDEGKWTNPTLGGNIVELVGIDESHASAMWEMVNDPVGAALTATTATFTREQIDTWCRTRKDKSGRIDLAIIDRNSGEFVGEVVLNDFDAKTNSAGFRISLRRPEVYGKGFGSEATQLVSSYSFAVLRLDRLVLEVLASNDRAIRVYSKNGFTRTKSFLEDDLDWIEMELLDPDAGSAV